MDRGMTATPRTLRMTDGCCTGLLADSGRSDARLCGRRTLLGVQRRQSGTVAGTQLAALCAKDKHLARRKLARDHQWKPRNLSRLRS
jgi:hypothetical protein